MTIPPTGAPLPSMTHRHLPIRPDLTRLEHEAEVLLHAMRRGDRSAVDLLQEHSPGGARPDRAALTDAQRVLARRYGVASWPRLVLACRMTEAIWRDDAEAVRDLVSRRPALLEENVLGAAGNWGAPMSYAANLGRDRIVTMLHDLGAPDLQHAFDRACVQGQIGTARALHAMGARPAPGSMMGPAESLNAAGLDLLFEMGAEIGDGHGNRLAPVAMLLETYARHPAGKHACLESMARHGIELPDTAPMAVHRGRIDLLESHLRRDADMLARSLAHDDIYPPELGCHADESLALHGTPLAGTTLLHLCVDFDEIELARWLIERGANVNARAAVDSEGFGGHTPLFGCVVSQPWRVGQRKDDEFARLLLDQGADVNLRASLRKRLRFVTDESMHEYRDVTPLAWGRRFHDPDWVSEPVMRWILDRGGHE